MPLTTTTSVLEQALAMVARTLCREVWQLPVHRTATPSLSIASPLLCESAHRKIMILLDPTNLSDKSYRPLGHDMLVLRAWRQEIDTSYGKGIDGPCNCCAQTEAPSAANTSSDMAFFDMRRKGRGLCLKNERQDNPKGKAIRRRRRMKGRKTTRLGTGA